MDPFTTAVIGWSTNQVGTAGLHGLRRLLGNKQQDSLRKVVRVAIESAVADVVPAGDQEIVQDALLVESPDNAAVEAGDVIDLREATLRQIGPRVASLTQQGYELDLARLADVLTAEIVAGIKADAVRGGLLKPLAEALWQERIATALETSHHRHPPTCRQAVGRLISQLAGPFELGVHKAIDIDPARAAAGELPVYVSRAHDQRLRQIVNAVQSAGA